MVEGIIRGLGTKDLQTIVETSVVPEEIKKKVAVDRNSYVNRFINWFFSRPPLEEADDQEIIEVAQKVYEYKKSFGYKIKSVLKRIPAYIGLIGILGYPIGVGSIAYDYSTFNSSGKHISSLVDYGVSEWPVPGDTQDALVIITGKESSDTVFKRDDRNFSASNSLFDLVLLSNLDNPSLKQTQREDFYHEVGHIIYSHLDTSNKQKVGELYGVFLQRAEKSRKHYEELTQKSKELCDKISGRAGEEFLPMKDELFDELEIVNKELREFINLSEEGRYVQFTQECSDPDEFYARCMEKLLAGNEDDFIPEEGLDVVRQTIDLSSTHTLDVVDSSIANFPRIYAHMFMEGLEEGKVYLEGVF